jgi:hypothetical protein
VLGLRLALAFIFVALAAVALLAGLTAAFAAAGVFALAARVLGTEGQSEHHPQRHADDGDHDDKLRR